MSFERTVLNNGIVVITEPMEQMHSVSLGLWLNVGSRDETTHQLGLAHFMEHMMFKGTPKRTPLDISLHFDSIGAEFNAFTSKQYTCYYARFMQDKLESALEVLADMVIHSSFADEAIATEREVVLEEIARSFDAPDDYVFDLFLQSLYPNHPLGRPVLGSRSLVSGYVHDDCAAFHKTHYVSGNLCVAAAGNVDHAALVSLVEQYFSPMSVQPKEQRSISPVPTAAGIFSEQRSIEQAHIVYGFPALPLGDKRRYALSVLTSILGGSMSARLFQEIREKRGLAYSVYASQGAYQGQGQWLVYAGTRPENVKEVVSLTKKELDAIAQGGVAEDEVQRNIDLICGQTVLSFETTSSHMMRLGRRETLGEEQVSINESIERFKQVNAQDCIDLAQHIFTLSPTIAVVSPLSESEITHLFDGLSLL